MEAAMTNNASGPVHDLLLLHGYRLVDDACNQDGRRTYVHDSDATRTRFIRLGGVLRPLGWTIDETKLRSFLNSETGEVIEIEPGGAETTGHFVHYMGARD
jgi:hypothetical protein